MEKVKINYDKEHDILFPHAGFENDEKFKGNIDFGEFVLDMSTKGRIRGIEIFKASECLSHFKVTKEILSNIMEADFKARVGHDSIVVEIVLYAVDKEIPATIALPIAQPQVIQHRKS